MAMEQLAPTVLRFRGLPNGVECIAPLDLGVNRNQKPHSSLSLALKSGEVSSSAMRIFHVSAGIARLWFPLPPYTPPGTYNGAVAIGGTEFPITIDVERHENLVLSPPQLNVLAPCGGQIAAHFTLANAGNVTCDVGKGHGFGLFDVEGAERAVGAALRDPTAQGRDKVDRLMDRLTDQHAGFVRMQVEKGEGPIAAGEVRELSVRVRFPDNMKAGRAYTGTWVLSNLAYQIRVSALGQDGNEPTRMTQEEEQ